MFQPRSYFHTEHINTTTPTTFVSGVENGGYKKEKTRGYQFISIISMKLLFRCEFQFQVLINYLNRLEEDH